MGFKSISTRVSTATSAVSTQAVMINTGTGNLNISGSKINANTSITLGVITPGQTSSSSSVTAAGGPTITGITYLDVNNNPTSANAVSTSGGNIQITGTGFVSGSSVYINNSLVSNTFVSSTQIRAICPAASAGNVSLMLFTPTLTGAMSGTGVRYSGIPSWTTSAVSFQNGSAANVSLVASSDSTLTYTLQAGSTLPTGISLVSSGYLSGTPTGYTTNTTGTIVLIATDAEGQAAQQTVNWTIAVNEPQFPNTTLLLSAATTGQTASFVKDNSTNNYPLTVAGDTRAQSYSPYYGNGYYSNYFDGATATRLSLPSNAVFAFGTSAYTMEGWVYITAAATYTSTLFDAGGATNSISLGVTSTGAVAIGKYGIGNVISSNAGDVPVGQWTHVAAVRTSTASNDTRIYVNGVLKTTGTDSNNWSVTTSPTVGGINLSGYTMTGYISNLRIVNGSAVYPSAFTPSTTPLTAIANTSLLTCQSNRFIDTSSNAATVTVAGTPKVTPAIPFAASSTYATYGSGYFDGTGDYLTVPDNAAFAFGTGNFTAEAWVNTANVAASPWIVGQWEASNGSDTNSSWMIATSGSKFIGYMAYNNSISQFALTGTSTITNNTWNHVAMVRNGNTAYLYVNGVQEASNSVIASYTLNNSTLPVSVGQRSGGTQYMNGYIADVRVANTAVYSTTFTPPTAPLTAVANTQLLTLQTNGAHNNSTFFDNSNFNNLITRAGNASNGTFSPYSATGWSNYFPALAYMTYAANPITTFGAGATFTVEGWVNMSVYPATNYFFNLLASCDQATALYWSIGIGSTGLATVYWYDGNAKQAAGSTILAKGTWYHVAAVVTSGVVKIYVNGVAETLTGTTTLTNPTGNSSYTTGTDRGSNNGGSAGYISNLRTNTGALYNANFTPSTTPLTNVANTTLLTAQSNRFIDNSSSARTITPFASTPPSVQAFSPFNASNSYSAATTGGSMYFDGTGDYLSTPYNAIYDITASDFTVEAWIYRTASAEQYIVHQRPPATANGWAFEVYTGNVLRFYYTGGSALIGTVTIPINAWTHVAATRSGTAFKTFVNGVLDINTTISSGTAATGSLYVGTDNTPGSTNMTGYISDLRIIKGSALYTTAFTPPAAPLTSTTATTFLLNGTAGAVIDAHGTVNLETVADAKVTTDKYPYSTAGQSYYFDGTGDYLSIPSNNTLDFGTGDFTIEFWVNFSALSTNRMILDRWASGNANSWQLYWRATGTSLAFLVGASTVLLQDPTSNTITTNTWYHVAVTRASGSNKMFINGNVVATATNSTSLTSSLALGIGRQYSTSTNDFNGYLSDLRITKGFARYTANFSVPTTPFLGQ